MSKVNESRRKFFKAVGIGISAISFIALKRSELGSLLKPARFTFVSAEERPASRAERKEAELKELYRQELDKIAREKGAGSPEYENAKARYKSIHVKDTGPKEGVRYAMALDLNKCIGCRRCAYACVMENNMGRNSGIEWIQVLELPRDNMDLLESNMDYGNEAPKEDMVYVPVACMHCEDPPCVMVCPVTATWKEKDGIVVVDYDRCIGCRYCATACPYNARHFNWVKPEVPLEELNPNMHILGNVPRPIHVMEKCTWCIQRTRDGGVPACVEICPVGARSFGDLNDPEGPIRRIIEEYGAFVLKPEAGTNPRFFYYFGPGRTPPREVSEGG